MWGSLERKIVMNNNSSSVANSLKVVITRIGEPSLAQYGAARTPVDSPQVAFDFWNSVVATDPAYESEKEHLVAILLDTKLRPKAYHVVSVGTINETAAHPREVFRAAIVGAAYGVVLMHNHPSGDPSPSTADRRMTTTMREASSLLQIQLVDHVIFGGGQGMPSFYSFRDSGLL